MNAKKLLCAVALVLPACVEPGPELGESADEITGAGATSASPFHLDRGVATFKCTATRISPQFALTALHCGTDVGSTVNFYKSSADMSSTLTATVAAWIPKPGIDVKQCHDELECDDQNGLFSDVALLRLNNLAVDMDGPAGAQATLAWTYPGNGAAGTGVGAGRHGDADNPFRTLKQIADTTDVGDDLDGSIWTTNTFLNKQDSGGPFYVQQRVLGVAHGGGGWDPLHGYYDKYTSVPQQLDWILGTIGYAWPGQAVQASTVYSGTPLQSFGATERECQYACDKTASCEAYNYDVATANCGLYTAVTGWYAQAGRRGALHYGASTGISNLVAGYRRSDGYSAVVHQAINGTIHELWNGGTEWNAGTIAPMAGQPVAGKLSVYRRSDGVNAIVYRSTSGRIIEISLGTSGWQAADLTAWGGNVASGDPVAYVRADGVSAVVFRSSNGHINELRLGPDSWIATDLSAVSGASQIAWSDPTPFVRADGLSSVVFSSGAAIIELFKQPGQQWAAGVPSSVTTNGAAPASSLYARPYGSTRRNGRAAIVYRSSTNRLIELRLEPSGWRFDDITGTGPAVGGNPVAYVRTDGVDSVVYRTTGNQLIEITRSALVALQTWNLSAQHGIPAVTTDPAVYVRVDGDNAVVYGLAGNHVGELSWHTGDPSWGRSDLTFSSGEQP